MKILCIGAYAGWNPYLLRKYLTTTGFPLENIFIETLFPCFTPVTIPYLTDNQKEHLVKIQTKIETLSPDIIITVGEIAMQLISGEWNLHLNDVHAYVLPYTKTAKPIPILPTFEISESYFVKNRKEWVQFTCDKALEILDQTLKPDPQFNIKIAPTFSETITFLNSALAAAELTIDIETTNMHEITCIGLLTNTGTGMVIPFSKQHLQHYFTEDEELKIWQALQILLKGPALKILQNFMFDTMVLHRMGIEVSGPFFDTMIAANYIYPELEKSLKALARLWCCCAPWKEKKDWHITGDPISLWKYNAIDISKTSIIANKQRTELPQHFWSFVNPLLSVFYDICTRGMAIDTSALTQLKNQTKSLLEPLEAQLIEEAAPIIQEVAKINRKRNKTKDIKGPSPKTGKTIILVKGYDEFYEPFNPRSTPQKRFVLETLGYKIPTKDGKKISDRNHLIRLYKTYPTTFLKNLLDYGKLEKLRNTYLNLVLDPDNRCRFVYNKSNTDNEEGSLSGGGTKSGRFTCSSTPWNTGINIQTIPKANKQFNLAPRKIFSSELGTLLQVDQKSAELYVVAWLSQDKILNNLLTTNADMHIYTATSVKEHTGIDCPRDLGKQLNYAGFYGCGPKKFTDICLLKADLLVSVADAAKMMEAMKLIFPGVEKNFKQWVLNELLTKQELTTPQGRKRTFFGIFDEAISDFDKSEVYRAGLSFIPQATVRDVGSGALLDIVKSPAYKKDFFLLMDGHDSFLFDTTLSYLPTLITTIKDAFSRQKLIIHNEEHLIPIDIQSGPNWHDLKGINA